MEFFIIMALHDYDLEEQVNKFLATLSPEQVISVSYSRCSCGGLTTYFEAGITYKKV
jgi:hypothetical protein